MLQFKVGEKVVHPAHGVGVIMGVVKKEIAGAMQTLYELRILDEKRGEQKVYVPTSMVGAVGLREIISEKEANQVYEILKERSFAVDEKTWNRRYRSYDEKIKSGSVFEIAEVLRDLYLLKQQKDLSFGERKMLDTARSLLIKELSLAKRVDEQKIEHDFQKIFHC
jgi:CarD family transcriptional regulator